MSQVELKAQRQHGASCGPLYLQKMEQTASSPSAFAPASAKATAGKRATADKRPSSSLGGGEGEDEVKVRLAMLARAWVTGAGGRSAAGW
jgi:hypothetical protein